MVLTEVFLKLIGIHTNKGMPRKFLSYIYFLGFCLINEVRKLESKLEKKLLTNGQFINLVTNYSYEMKDFALP